jgi:hypothetical protein
VPLASTGAPIAPHAGIVATCTHRQAELRTPELVDLRGATRTDGAGIGRAESAICREQTVHMAAWRWLWATHSSSRRSRDLTVADAAWPGGAKANCRRSLGGLGEWVMGWQRSAPQPAQAMRTTSGHRLPPGGRE